MDYLKTLLEALRASAYSLAALILPGAFLVEVVRRAFGIEGAVPWDPPVPYITCAYVAGFTLQGVSSRMFGWQLFRKATTNDSSVKDKDQAIETARALLAKRYDVDNLPPPSVVDVALTKAGEHREVYDKFTALRDMSRSLATVFAVMTVAAGVRLVLSSASGNGLMIRECAAALVVGIVGFWGTVDRYRRLQTLPEKAIAGVFVAQHLKERLPLDNKTS